MTENEQPTALATPYRPLPSLASPDQEFARAILRSEVASPGDLIWVGRPPRGLRFRTSDVFVIPFSLMWGGFAIFWEVMVVVSHGPLFMKLWGIPFVVVGQYLIWGRFIFDAWKRARTFYGLTNDRAIIVTVGRTRTVKSLQLRAEPAIELEEASGGRGTIRFGRAPSGRRTTAQPPMFEGIENAREVYVRIRENVGR